MSETLGKVTIAHDVLLSIARLTALAMPGVAGLRSRGMRSLLGGKEAEAVSVSVDDDGVTVDVHIVVKHDANMLQLSRELQAKIARAIQDMVGMDVVAVNVYIKDVEFPVFEE